MMIDPAMRPNRRDSSQNDRLEILQLLEAKTITADEADQLLDAIDKSDRTASASAQTRPIGGPARHLRLRITDSTTGKVTLNIVLPLGFIDAGLGLARRVAPDRVPDVHSLQQTISEGFRGALLNIDEAGEKIEIIVE